MQKKKCLIIRKYAYIGDLLMMTPALRKLGETYDIDDFVINSRELINKEDGN